jgi:hypothetical protein
VLSKLTFAPNRLHEQAFAAGIAHSAQQRDSDDIIVEVTFLLSFFFMRVRGTQAAVKH